MSDLNVGGMTIAQSVVETIVSLAVKDVEGVASIGSVPGGLSEIFSSKPETPSVDVTANEAGALHIALRIEVYYGYVLPELAAKVRESVAEAVSSQIGAQIEAVDVYIDGMQFAK